MCIVNPALKLNFLAAKRSHQRIGKSDGHSSALEMRTKISIPVTTVVGKITVAASKLDAGSI